ncbi:hypothetical protein BpHYR1_053397 [Brachionus plicatilis]|uniref:Uncharacterized protein n=1 Tax=Brachionus plicatilis TaxID=10195 RepID=A0A3M7QY78_BRAPC|nr:hypothetical protein BpHYR1_053397 [Brachionus plicatilis]
MIDELSENLNKFSMVLKFIVDPSSISCCFEVARVYCFFTSTYLYSGVTISLKIFIIFKEKKNFLCFYMIYIIGDI